MTRAPGSPPRERERRHACGRRAQDHIREQGRVGLQHVDMQVVIVVWAGGVIRVALHQHQLPVDLQDRVDSLLHFADRGGACGDEEWLALPAMRSSA